MMAVRTAKHAKAHSARAMRHTRQRAEEPALAPPRRLPDWIALALLMLAAGFVFFWNLTASGYANEFYSAAAQAGSQSWEAFLWGGLDAGGAITVDKPPASIWLMALSVRLLGLSSFAILLPQALMGMACTYLVYAIVRRGWGNAAGIVGGAVFVTTPVAALMFRFNNPDALLVLLMLGASASVLRGLELPATAHGNRRRTAWYALAGACIGLGFLTKQFQVLLVLPGFAIAMLVLSPTRMPRRLLDAVVALGSMCLAAGWWIALTVLVPSGSRPYFGGSQTDSFIELTFGYNGLGRLTGDETGSVVPGAEAGTGTQGGMWGETGIARLWTSDFGDQITWLALLAFSGIVIGLVAARALRKSRGGDDALVRIRKAQVAVFGGWLLVTWLVFSFMAGIFHAYYTVALAPAIAVPVAICAAGLHELRDRPWTPAVAGALIAFSSAWCMALVLRSDSFTWLGAIIGVIGVTSGIALCVVGYAVRSDVPTRGVRCGMRVLLALGTVAIMAGPVTWTACTVATGHTGSIVTAGPSQGGMGQGGGGMLDGKTANDELTELLTSTASGYRWAAATTGSQNAASLQLSSELPVMAVGGFNGSDPAPTLDEFKSYVEQGLVKYYIEGGGMGGSQMGGSDAASQIETWVAQNFTAQTVGNTTVYDLQSS